MAFLGKVGGPKISEILKRQGYQGTGFVRIVPTEGEFLGFITREKESEKAGVVVEAARMNAGVGGKDQFYTSYATRAGNCYCELYLTPDELEQIGEEYKQKKARVIPPPIPPGGNGFSHTDVGPY